MSTLIHKKKSRNLRRILSLILIATFFATNVSFAVPQEKTPTQGVIDEASFVKSPENIVIPRDLGLVKSTFKGKASKLIVHIQDAHCNFEAQTNIVKILENLIRNYNLKLISVEGAEGYIDTAWFKAFPDADVRREVATYFMKKGEITGPEFLSITEDYPIKLFGAERKDYYIKNLNAFTSSYQYKETAEKYFNRIKTILDRLKGYIYNDALKEFDAKIQDHASKRISFNDYSRFLQDLAKRYRMNVRAYPNFFKLVNTLVYEKKIDFTVVDKERNTLIDELTKKLSKEAVQELVLKSLTFKVGKISSAEYYTYLRSAASKNGIVISAAYPDLSNYIIYVSVYSRIENETLFREIEKLETAIKEKMFKNDEQRTLDKLSRNVGILLGLIDIKLLNNDFDYYVSHKEEFKPQHFLDFIEKLGDRYGLAYKVGLPERSILEEALPKLEDFYAIAIKRDRAIVDNTIRAMKNEKTQLAVLVSGGFHTEGITGMLKKQGVSYLVVSPNITKDVETPYIQVLTNQRTPFEEILIGAAEAKGNFIVPALFSALLSLYLTKPDQLRRESSNAGFAENQRSLLDRAAYDWEMFKKLYAIETFKLGLIFDFIQSSAADNIQLNTQIIMNLYARMVVLNIAKLAKRISDQERLARMQTFAMAAVYQMVQAQANARFATVVGRGRGSTAGMPKPSPAEVTSPVSEQFDARVIELLQGIPKSSPTKSVTIAEKNVLFAPAQNLPRTIARLNLEGRNLPVGTALITASKEEKGPLTVQISPAILRVLNSKALAKLAKEIISTPGSKVITSQKIAEITRVPNVPELAEQEVAEAALGKGTESIPQTEAVRLSETITSLMPITPDREAPSVSTKAGRNVRFQEVKGLPEAIAEINLGEGENIPVGTVKIEVPKEEGPITILISPEALSLLEREQALQRLAEAVAEKPREVFSPQAITEITGVEGLEGAAEEEVADAVFGRQPAIQEQAPELPVTKPAAERTSTSGHRPEDVLQENFLGRLSTGAAGGAALAGLPAQIAEGINRFMRRTSISPDEPIVEGKTILQIWPELVEEARGLINEIYTPPQLLEPRLQGRAAIIAIDETLFGTPIKKGIVSDEAVQENMRWEFTNPLITNIEQRLARAGFIVVRARGAGALQEAIENKMIELRGEAEEKGKKAGEVVRSVVTIAHDRTVKSLQENEFFSKLTGKEETLTAMLKSASLGVDRAVILEVDTSELHDILDSYLPIMKVFQLAVKVANYDDRNIAALINDIQGTKKGDELFVTPDEVPNMLAKNIIRLLPAIRRIDFNRSREAYKAALQALESL